MAKAPPKTYRPSPPKGYAPKSVVVAVPPPPPKQAAPKNHKRVYDDKTPTLAEVKAASLAGAAARPKLVSTKIKGIAAKKGHVTDKPGEQARKRRGGKPPKKPPTPASWKPGQRGTPYIYDKAPDGQGKQHTMTSLAEAMFSLDAKQIREYEPKTVGEVAIRSAWIRAMAGDSRILNMMWDRLFAGNGSSNPLADLLAQMGKSAALQPQITNQQPQPQTNEDEDED